MPTTIERKNRADGQSERLSTTIERDENISPLFNKNKHFCDCLTHCRTCSCANVQLIGSFDHDSKNAMILTAREVSR